MDKASQEIFQKLYDLHDRYDESPEHMICAHAADHIKKLSEELEKLKAVPENKPLTLEELRKMDNQPVWTDSRCGVVRAVPQITRRPGMPAIHFNYGWEWADDVLKCSHIYAHKPEEK